MPSFDLCDVYQGTDYSLTFQAKDVNGNPLDLTNYFLSSIIKSSISAPTGLANFSYIIPTPTSGICQISLSYLQTSGLPINTYVYYVRAVNSGGSGAFNLLEGYLNVNPFN